MKYVNFFFFLFIFGSCGSAQKLLEKNTEDGGKIIVKKGLFSGIDYIYVEKKMKSKIVYKLFYDCECGIANEIRLKKEDLSNKEKTTVWTAITDTTNGPTFFGEAIAASRLYSPLEFMPITQEERSLLEEGLSKVNKECCKNPSKPVKDIIGYVRVKTN